MKRKTDWRNICIVHLDYWPRKAQGSVELITDAIAHLCEAGVMLPMFVFGLMDLAHQYYTEQN